jgi:hypothetical protein
MKLRIDGDAIRFRLNRHDVETFARSGRAEASVHFPGSTLRYVLESDDRALAMTAEHEPGLIRVRVPAGLGTNWAAGDDVAIESKQAQLHILIEKDFQCLHKGEDARDPNAYPNPAAVR